MKGLNIESPNLTFAEGGGRIVERGKGTEQQSYPQDSRS